MGALVRGLNMESSAVIESIKAIYGKEYVLFEAAPTEAEMEAVQWLN